MRRRAVGLVLAALPALVLFASLGVGLRRPNRLGWAAGATLALAGAVTALNVTTSFVRPLVNRWRGVQARHVSGLPAVGSLLVLISAALGFGSIVAATLGLALYALDTAGAPWFVAATWRDDGLWGRW